MSSKSNPKERKMVPKGVPNSPKSAKVSQKGCEIQKEIHGTADWAKRWPRPGGLREAVSDPRPGGLREALTINNNNKLGLRRGLWGHSFNSSYSLELNFDFAGKSLLGISTPFRFGIWANLLKFGENPDAAHPGHSWQAFLFSE